MTGIDENNFPGRMHPMINRMKMVNAGIQRLLGTNSVSILTETISSICCWKLSIRKIATRVDRLVINSVSHKKIQKMLLFSAPLHLCTPMALARCESEDMEISA